MTLEELSTLNKESIALVDVAKAILVDHEEVMHFDDLLAQVADFLELTDEAIDDEIVQFYTDLNTNGGFISLGENRWGLRSWYPIDSIDEELTYKNDSDDEVPRIYDEEFDEDFEDDLEDDQVAYTDEEFDDASEPIQADFFDANAEAQYLDDEESGTEELSEYEDDLEELDVDEVDEYEGDTEEFEDEED